MNSRERMKKILLEKGSADKIPWTFDFGATQGLNPSLLQRYKEKNGIKKPIYEYFNYDIIAIPYPETRGPEELNGGITFVSNISDPTIYYENIPENAEFDAWGILWYCWPTDPTFKNFKSPLALMDSVAEIENYPEPGLSIKSIGEVSRWARKVREAGKMSACYAGSIYEWSWWLRGQINFMEDLLLAPTRAKAVVDKVKGFTKKLALASQEAGCDVLAFYDDAGMQSSLQISPELWRRFIKPAFKEIVSEIKRRNPETITFLHSCGDIGLIIPDIIEIGFDVLHPLQPETMDVYQITSLYAGKIAFWGTISNQKTMPFGSPQDVRLEVREKMERLGKEGGFILSPSNILCPDVPLSNLDAFVEEASKF
ncbi:MAG: hypothetical protein DDT32_01354 [Syntrophomonadaceae bacterium]|nr:hypothetical protein [Bacillota bacterium]